MYRDGETIEEKKLPRYMEGLDDIGTAQYVGSTAISCLLFKNKVYTANLGDSRAVMAVDSGKKPKLNKSSSDSQTKQRTLTETVALSNDHKPYNALEMKRITEAGGSVKNNRVNADLAVSRALGDLNYKSDSKLKSH